MSRLAHLLEEPETRDPAQYGRRVRWLAVVHVLLFLTCAAGAVLLIWRGELFVTLAASRTRARRSRSIGSSRSAATPSRGSSKCATSTARSAGCASMA